jgi:hypothetical protein
MFEDMEKSVDECIQRWARKEDVTEEMFNGWRSTVLEQVKSRIETIKESAEWKEVTTLMDQETKKKLREVQEEFVLVPTDKAEMNVSIVCKAYYIHLTVVGLTQTQTFRLLRPRSKTS